MLSHPIKLQCWQQQSVVLLMVKIPKDNIDIFQYYVADKELEAARKFTIIIDRAIFHKITLIGSHLSSLFSLTAFTI